jgi:hypothetical protein
VVQTSGGLRVRFFSDRLAPKDDSRSIYVITFLRLLRSSHMKTTFRRCVWGDNRSTKHSRVQDYIHMNVEGMPLSMWQQIATWRGHVKSEMAPCAGLRARGISDKNRLCFHTTSTPLSIPLGTFGQPLKTDRMGIPKPKVPEHNSVLRLPHRANWNQTPRWQV